MSNRKALNSVQTTNQVINNLNTWHADEDCDQDELENKLDNFVGS